MLLGLHSVVGPVRADRGLCLNVPVPALIGHARLGVYLELMFNLHKGYTHNARTHTEFQSIPARNTLSVTPTAYDLHTPTTTYTYRPY